MISVSSLYNSYGLCMRHSSSVQCPKSKSGYQWAPRIHQAGHAAILSQIVPLLRPHLLPLLARRIDGIQFTHFGDRHVPPAIAGHAQVAINWLDIYEKISASGTLTSSVGSTTSPWMKTCGFISGVKMAICCKGGCTSQTDLIPNRKYVSILGMISSTL